MFQLENPGGWVVLQFPTRWGFWWGACWAWPGGALFSAVDVWKVGVWCRNWSVAGWVSIGLC